MRDDRNDDDREYHNLDDPQEIIQNLLDAAGQQLPSSPYMPVTIKQPVDVDLVDYSALRTIQAFWEGGQPTLTIYQVAQVFLRAAWWTQALMRFVEAKAHEEFGDMEGPVQ